MNRGSYLPQDHYDAPSPESPMHWPQLTIGDTSFSEEKRKLASVVLVPSAEASTKQLIDGPSSQPMWQIQYYSESLESSSSESLLEQTRKEEDERFYATFPQARRQWTPQALPHSEYFGDTAFHLSHQGFQSSQSSWYGSSCEPSSSTHFTGSVESMKVEGVSPLLTPDHARMYAAGSSELMAAIDLSGGESAAQIDSNPSLTSTMSGYDKSIQLEKTAKLESADGLLSHSPKSLPSLLPLDTQSIARTEGGIKEQPMDFLSPSDSSTSVSPLYAANTEDLQIYEDGSGVASSSAATVIPLAMPSPPEPPALMRLSPLPANRRPAEKKKAQTLACNFCRVRKIACGPPLAGTKEKICNQCQRRSRECVFPTESRRGMRKKKPIPPASG